LKEVLPPNPKPVAAKKVLLVDRPGSVQTTVVLGNIALDRRDPDYIALSVANHILGGGPAARLFLNLREEKGYTYGVYSSFTALKYPGPWRAGGDVRTEVTAGAMTEFFKEFQRIRDEKVPASELDEAKRAIVASFALSLERPAELLGYAIVRKLYNFPPDYWDNYPAQVMAVTADDIQRVARKYINPDNLQVVAVGDLSKIRPVMEKYGPVEVYNAEGKKVGN
jgi:predicted Zn-dependent peptidase